MTDYFALLDQPRKPWLDPDELKQAFHAGSLRLHPDAQRHDGGLSGEKDGAFSELNEAYQALLDPKRRIHHLLSLEGRALTDRQAPVPAEIEQLFSAVAAATQEVDALLQKCEAATTTLSRSLLRPHIIRLQHTIAETLRQLAQLHEAGIAELRRLNNANVLREDDWSVLQALYLRFSYVTRWIAELQEKQNRLATA